MSEWSFIMKKIIYGLVILVFISLVFLGYTLYDNQLVNSFKKQTLTIDIAMKHENGKLIVTETVTPLDNGQAVLLIPNHLDTLYIKKGDEYIPYEEKGISFKQHEPITFFYEYSLPCQHCILDQYALRFSDGETVFDANYRVAISEANRATTWLSGSAAYETLQGEFYTFYSWKEEKKKNVPLFLTQASIQAARDTEKLSVFFEEGESVTVDESFLIDYSKNNHVTVLLTNAPLQYSEEGLLVFSKDTNEKDYKRLFLQSLYSEKQFEKPLLQSLLMSIILDLPASKGEEAYFSELKQTLQAEDWPLFQEQVARLYQTESMFTYKQLDVILQGQLGKKTTFFQTNKDADVLTQPLYFVETQDAFVNENKINSNWNVIMYENQYYVPVKEVADSFDFYVEELTNSNTIYFSKGDKMIYLPLDEGYEVVKPVSYEVKMFEDRAYVTEKTLKLLFDISLHKKNNQFYFTSP